LCCEKRSYPGPHADFYGVPAWYGAAPPRPRNPASRAPTRTPSHVHGLRQRRRRDLRTGLLDGSRILCLENMVVDDEILGMVKRILRGVEGRRTIARDLIVKMGFKATTCSTTIPRHVRDSGRPSSARPAPTRWKAAGAKSTVEKAQDKVREILAADRRLSRRPRPRVRRDHRRRRETGRLAALRGRAGAGGLAAAPRLHSVSARARWVATTTTVWAARRPRRLGKLDPQAPRSTEEVNGWSSSYVTRVSREIGASRPAPDGDRSGSSCIVSS